MDKGGKYGGIGNFGSLDDCKNTKKEVMGMNELKLNGSGYPDPTAFKAMEALRKQESKRKGKKARHEEKGAGNNGADDICKERRS